MVKLLPVTILAARIWSFCKRSFSVELQHPQTDYFRYLEEIFYSQIIAYVFGCKELCQDSRGNIICTFIHFIESYIKKSIELNRENYN